MTAKQFRMKKANHTETPSGLTAAFNRGKALAVAGLGELQLNDAMNRCASKDAASMLKQGYESALESKFKI